MEEGAIAWPNSKSFKKPTPIIKPPKGSMGMRCLLHLMMGPFLLFMRGAPPQNIALSPQAGRSRNARRCSCCFRTLSYLKMSSACFAGKPSFLPNSLLLRPTRSRWIRLICCCWPSRWHPPLLLPGLSPRWQQPPWACCPWNWRLKSMKTKMSQLTYFLQY